MREVLNRVAGFVPIALIITFQLIRFMRNRAENEKKKGAPQKPGAPVKTGDMKTGQKGPFPEKRPVKTIIPKPKKPEVIVRGHWETDDNDKTKKPPVQIKAPVVAKKHLGEEIRPLSSRTVIPPPKSTAKPVPASLPTARPTEAASRPSTTSLPSVAPAARLADAVSLPSAMPAVMAARPPAETAVQSAQPLDSRAVNFPQNLDYLSPLKRAVVMAEILGPPKWE